MLLSKKDYCALILEESGVKDTENFTDFDENNITISSKVAVAAEHLGLIKDQKLKKYASSRDGILHTYSKIGDDGNLKINIMTVRDLLEVLPD